MGLTGSGLTIHRNKISCGTASAPHQTNAFCSRRLPSTFAASSVRPYTRKLSSRPSIARVLPDAQFKSKAPLLELPGKCRLPLSIGGCIQGMAEWIPSRQKSTALRLEALVGGKQFGTSLPYLQGKSRLCKNTVLRLLEGLDGGGINDRCRQ